MLLYILDVRKIIAYCREIITAMVSNFKVAQIAHDTEFQIKAKYT